MMTNVETVKLLCLKLLPTVCMPTHATLGSVGLDLYGLASVLIPAHDKILVDLGVAFQIPVGCYGWMASRSGLAIHHHIHVGAGVMDPDCMGSVHVLLMNFGSQDHVMEKNHHIAQMILEKVAYPVICEVLWMLPAEHGANGFGSTGQ